MLSGMGAPANAYAEGGQFSGGNQVYVPQDVSAQEYPPRF